MVDESNRTVFNLGQDRIVSSPIKQRLDRDQITHQLSNGRQGRFELWRPQHAPCLQMLGHEHPTTVEANSIQGALRMQRLILVGRREVLTRLQTITITVEINPQHRQFRGPCQSRIRQCWCQRPSTFEQMDTPSCVGPCMGGGTSSSSTSTHAKDCTPIWTASCDTSEGHDTSPVCPC